MKRFHSLSYYINYKLKEASVEFRTFRFDREIKKAYASEGFRISPAGALSWVSEHPWTAGAVPALILAGLLAFSLAPRLKGIHLPQNPVASLRHAFKAKTAARPATAEAPETAAPAPRESPEKKFGRTFVYTLLADKTKKQLSLFKFFPDGSTLLQKTYSIAIGEKWGRKMRQGDLKTPEGAYWITNRMEDWELPPIYGIRAFILNYPNEQDMREHRSGTGIWIHGVEAGKRPDKSKGCLELDNADLAELTPFIGIGTPIVITESAPAPEDSLRRYFAWEPLIAKRDSFVTQSKKSDQFAQTFVERWRVAWESKDIDDYAALYAPDFSQNGMGFAEWKEYKRAIFSRTQDISINALDIKLTRLANDTATITFTQEYISGPYKAVNGKTLKIARMDNDWKITEESKTQPIN